MYGRESSEARKDRLQAGPGYNTIPVRHFPSPGELLKACNLIQNNTLSMCGLHKHLLCARFREKHDAIPLRQFCGVIAGGGLSSPTFTPIDKPHVAPMSLSNHTLYNSIVITGCFRV